VAQTTYNDVLCVAMRPKMRPVGMMKKRKNDKLSWPDHQRRHSHWHFACGR